MNTKSNEFIIHGYLVLAEFMGFKVSPDMLLKVVEKIESLKVDDADDEDDEDQNYSVQIERNYCQVYNPVTMEVIFSTEADTKTDAMFETCVKFAEWYNENH